eukprot:753924-Pyramimonas_sp.AAC.1
MPLLPFFRASATREVGAILHLGAGLELLQCPRDQDRLRLGRHTVDTELLEEGPDSRDAGSQWPSSR